MSAAPNYTRDRNGVRLRQRRRHRATATGSILCPRVSHLASPHGPALIMSRSDLFYHEASTALKAMAHVRLFVQEDTA